MILCIRNVSYKHDYHFIRLISGLLYIWHISKYVCLSVVRNSVLNRACKSRRTLQNKVRIKVFTEQ